MEPVAVAIIPTHAAVETGESVFDKVRTLLAKANLQQADIDEIKRLEETIPLATRRQPQFIIAILIQKALDEEKPNYFEYAHQIANTMEVPIGRGFHNWIETSKKPKKIL
ncbi:MAG: hypothetical protein LLG04_07380 [Parachlamydia sp.]|nr:hypothetical protein [Parachlamydia sp.]